MKAKLGIRSFWPELEPKVRSRLMLCVACRSNVVRENHASSKRHKLATQPAIMGPVRKERPTHLRDPYGDRRDYGSASERRAWAATLKESK